MGRPGRRALDGASRPAGPVTGAAWRRERRHSLPRRHPPASPVASNQTAGPRLTHTGRRVLSRARPGGASAAIPCPRATPRP